jgi:hypothetical protein
MPARGFTVSLKARLLLPQNLNQKLRPSTWMH